jgi:hypothetical protein
VLYVEQTAVRDYMRLQSGGDGPNKKKKEKRDWELVDRIKGSLLFIRHY